MSEIQPAMMPEEWATAEADVFAGYIDLRLGVIDIRLGDSHPHDASQDRHALAALLLHGQPFGFTWADVDHVLAAADDAEGEGGSAEYVARYRDLADRIAALLPPREPPA